MISAGKMRTQGRVVVSMENGSAVVEFDTEFPKKI